MEILDVATWARPSTKNLEHIRDATATMLAEIRDQGAAAIRRFSTKFDGFEPEPVALKPFEAYPLADAERQAIRHAAGRIEAFCQLQRGMYRDLTHRDECGTLRQRIEPLDSMAAYIPGGRFPLISTALMTLLPAKVAGVPRRVALSPSAHPALLAAASLAGATSFLRIGGAQAIAAGAMGYSPHLEAVAMVVGPGNAYVNAAKGLLQTRVKIDTLAGPSELLILADDSAEPDWIVADMLAQAEHDPMALSVLCATPRSLLETVRAKLLNAANQLGTAIGSVCLVHAKDERDLVIMADKMAAEHLHLNLRPDTLDSRLLRHYGSLFIGPHSAVALGDYCSGPNHTLPTNGYARYKGGLHVGDFLKVLTVQEITPAGFESLASTAETLAQMEGLKHHAESIAIRRR